VSCRGRGIGDSRNERRLVGGLFERGWLGGWDRRSFYRLVNDSTGE
jgi:hypothetical protein